MDLGLGLAIDACVNENTAIINRIIQKIKEVRTFKSKCAALGEHARLLRALLVKHSSAVESFQTLRDFRACLEHIEEFVSSCKQFSVLDVSLEVFVKRTYPALLKEISELKEIFLFESVTEILSREGVVCQNVNDVQNSVAQERASQREILANLRQLGQAERARRESPFALVSAVSPGDNFPHYGEIEIVFELDDNTVGRSHIEGLGSVMCFEMQLTTFSLASLEIYQKIQAGSFVERFLGIAKREGKLYAIMEYLGEEESLARACQYKSLPRNILERVQLAYDLSKTMAWFHRAEMLLKSVSDQTVIMKRLPSGRLCPILSRLENSRHFLERTSGIEYDLRYEAPEFEFHREHTRYTDIWSLGTVIWQIMSEKFPYSCAKPVLLNCSEFTSVSENLHRNILPGSITLASHPVLTSIIRQCWQRDPRLRPTATAIAETLQDLITNLTQFNFGGLSLSGSSSPSDSNSHMEKVIEKSLDLIDKARKGTFPLPRSKVSAADFNLFFNDCNSWSPVKYFAVGALIWWELTEENVLDMGNDLIETLPFSVNERRARLSLHFLELAASAGYGDAFREMCKAHKLLYTEMKAKIN